MFEVTLNREEATEAVIQMKGGKKNTPETSWVLVLIVIS